VVAAAADLIPLESPLTDSFQKATGNRVRFAFGSSGMLTQQIRNGAPYDVFLSANEDFVRSLAEAGDIDRESVKVYAIGRIALWSKDGSVKDVGALLDPRVRHIAIANPAHAPYGVAARDLLSRLGLWPKLASRVVYGENVRQTLQYAESGNAEAAIVAWSLVFDRGGVLLAANHVPIRQVGGMVSRTRQAAVAARFLVFLAGPEGQAILKRFGFEPASR